MEKIKILMIVDNLNKCDGIASYVMNYYKRMDLEKFSIDVLVSKSDNGICDEYRKMIEETGGKVFCRHNIKNKDIIKDMKTIKKFYDENNYDIVHCHIINMGYFYLRYARLNGIKIRILHSHTTYLWADNIIKRIRNAIFTYLAKKNANYNFACSDLAGKALFGKNKYTIINNAIDLEKYKFCNDIRESYRKQLNVQDATVYAHVGRFNVQKNHVFLIDIFEKIYHADNNAKLLLIGKGELHKEIEEKVHQRGLEKSVIFLGERDDVNKLLQAADIFLLPSLFEGLPIVGIEAQASGLPCYFSNKITSEVKILDNATFLDINDAEEWRRTILNNSNKHVGFDVVNKKMVQAGYSIEKEVEKIEKIYKKIVTEKK